MADSKLLDILSSKIMHLEIEDPSLNKLQKAKWENLLEEKKKIFTAQLEAIPEKDKFESCKNIALGLANTKAKMQKENIVNSMICSVVSAKTEGFNRELEQFRSVTKRLEEICRDYSQKNKELECENKRFTVQEEANRNDCLNKFNQSLKNINEQINDEKIQEQQMLNERLKAGIDFILEDDRSLDREYKEFIADNQKGNEGKQHNVQKFINENINKAMEEASRSKEELQLRMQTIAAMKMQIEELKKKTNQISGSIKQSEEIIIKYEEDLELRDIAIKKLADELAPKREQKRIFDIELLSAFEANKKVLAEIDTLSKECNTMQKKMAKS